MQSTPSKRRFKVCLLSSRKVNLAVYLSASTIEEAHDKAAGTYHTCDVVSVQEIARG